jgi:hypothetical protein
VGFHDGFGDGQPHARALNTVALVAAAVELVKDQGLFEVIDAVSVIGDAGDYAISLLLRGDSYG